MAAGNALPHRLPLHALHLRHNTIMYLPTLSPLLHALLHANCGADHDSDLAEGSFVYWFRAFGERNTCGA